MKHPEVGNQSPDSALARHTRILYLTNEISDIWKFDGEPRELDWFLQRAEPLMESIHDGELDEETAGVLARQLIGRVSRNVLREIGADLSTPWEDVRKGLRERYAGARAKLMRDSLALFRSTPRPGESLSEYAARVNSGVQRLLDQVYSIESRQSDYRAIAAFIVGVARQMVADRSSSSSSLTHPRRTGSYK